ncbi:MAG TPA: hypothetical protein VGH23_10835 [Rhizomicrobium sp.]
MENDQKSLKNKILASLTPEDFNQLQPHLKRVDLPNRKILEVRNRRIESVYFLESGLASMVVSGGSQHAIEAGIIGREGMTAPALLMNVDRSPHEIFMQMGGRVATHGQPLDPGNGKERHSKVPAFAAPLHFSGANELYGFGQWPLPAPGAFGALAADGT